MEKNKYYILRDLDDLEWFFKLGIVDFSIYNKEGAYFILKKQIQKNNIVVVYSKDGKYDGWDYFYFMNNPDAWKAIEFKVYLRKFKLGLLDEKR